MAPSDMASTVGQTLAGGLSEEQLCALAAGAAERAAGAAWDALGMRR